MQPLLHPLTETALSGVMRQPEGSYIFQGPRSLGKHTSARWLLLKLCCQNEACGKCSTCLQISSGAYPDLIQIAPEGKSIGIDQIQTMQKAIGLTNYQAGTRAVIIDQAEMLTTEAQNCLLKTMEEPPEGTMMILLASQPEKLLETVRSRAKIVNFISLGETELVDYLIKLGAERDSAVMAAETTGGVVGAAINLVQDKTALENHRQSADIIDKLLSADVFSRLVTAGKLAESSFDSPTFTAALIARCRRELREAASAGDRRRTEGLAGRMVAIDKWVRYQSANVNSRAALEALMLEL